MTPFLFGRINRHLGRCFPCSTIGCAGPDGTKWAEMAHYREMAPVTVKTMI